MLSRNAGFTAVAVIALAIGVGVNTAAFTAYKAMVARPLDARDPGRMINLALIRQSGAPEFNFSYPDFVAYRDSAHSFSGVIAFKPERMRLTGAGGTISQRDSAAGSALGKLGLLPSGASKAEFVSVFTVSENYFKVLGVSPLEGSSFEPIPIPDLLRSPSVLISENYWQQRFARDPAVLGKTIRLNGIALVIAGITPHDFVGTGVAVPDFWLPLSLAPLVHADDNWLHDRENLCCRLFARLAPGAGVVQAEAEVTLTAGRLRALHDPRSVSAKPGTMLVWRGSPFPLPIHLYPALGLSIAFIMAAAAMVLAVACANVASLQLARARSRQTELHTRLSLGASRLRVVRQLLTESALLAILAGIVALLFTWALLQIAVTFAAQALPAEGGTLIFHVAPDLEIFGYVFAVSLLAGILFGLAPAIESSGAALSSAVRGGTSSIGSRRLQKFFIAAQVALSLVLMIAGSMLIRSAIHALNMETGYDAKHVLDLDLQFPEGPKYAAGRRLALVRELRAHLKTLPGVVSVTSAQPPDVIRSRTLAVPLDREEHSLQNVVYYAHIEPNYFETLGIAVFLGRGFESQSGQLPHSVVLSESAASQLWPHQNPIGRSLRLGPVDGRVHPQSELTASGPAYQVIGVARDTRGVQFDGSDSKMVYLPLEDDHIAATPILIRAQSDPAQLTRPIDRLLASVDPDLAGTTSTLHEMLRGTAPFIVASLAAAVASTVGLLGLLLASMGIYGSASYAVVLRTREIGIRMAIGAQRRSILRLILRESTQPVLVGLLAGMLLSAGVSYLLRGLLYGLNRIDALSFVGVSLLFLVIAIVAAYPPSRRAMHVDPMVALRYE